jgi:hypothetical protein
VTRAALRCVVCAADIGDGERFVLVRRRREEAHCSQLCLVANVDRRRRVRAAVRRRWLVRLTALALIGIGGPKLWHRIRLPPSQTISFESPEVRPAPEPRPEPPMYGPAWPPTDEDWLTAFANVAWTYPLPGPARRAPRADDRIFASRPSGHRPAPDPLCRAVGKCGVDLGGELWGEQVYAAQDGVVVHVQHGTGDDRGDVYVRLAHLGGMVFTHYAHLAAVPRGITRGAVVKAGEVIGLVGDAGSERPGRYLHFALSVHPSNELPEVYWDPTDLMLHWPLKLPPHGTVAGFLPRETDLTAPVVSLRTR